MKIKNLNFVRTCFSCPEQYDVFDKNNNIVGYVRLRYGVLSCEFPDVGGECIYYRLIGNEWSGSFPTEEQRKQHLINIAEQINIQLEKKRRKMIMKWNKYDVIHVILCGVLGFVCSTVNLFTSTWQYWVLLFCTIGSYICGIFSHKGKKK